MDGEGRVEPDLRREFAQQPRADAGWQPALDAFTTALTANLPMGIHAESVGVTDSGVTAKYVTRDAAIPNGAQDPCFAGV